jgi:hypothetical protein
VRALVVASSSRDCEPPPSSWDALPNAPFAPFEEGARGELPVRGAFTIDDAGPRNVSIAFGGRAPIEVPRYWLARMLYRIALHGYALGYVETYGRFYCDDRDGGLRIGVVGQGSVMVAREDRDRVVEALYRAVAPEGYRERIE